MNNFETNLTYFNDTETDIFENNENIFIMLFLSLLYGSISVISVFGNALIIIVVLKNKRMKSVTNYFITNLALADIVIGVFAAPFQVKIFVLMFYLFLRYEITSKFHSPLAP